jgi:hypothetical protein
MALQDKKIRKGFEPVGSFASHRKGRKFEVIEAFVFEKSKMYKVKFKDGQVLIAYESEVYE